MKKTIFILLAVVLLLLGVTLPGQAHFRRGVWVGPVWGPGWWGPYGPYGYPYPSYYSPPVVVQQEPQEYVYQPAPRSEQQYWYFCQDPQGYYPNVKKCPKGWLKVVPNSAPPQGKE